MADPETPAPSAPRLVNHASATGVVTLMLALLGFVLAYVAALVVVKLGLGGPGLFVGLPLIAVGSLAWATSAAPQTLTLRLIEIATAGGLATAVLVLADPPYPARLLDHESEVADVALHGDDATITLATRTRLTSMPPMGSLLALTTILAGLAIAGSSLGRCFVRTPPAE